MELVVCHYTGMFLTEHETVCFSGWNRMNVSVHVSAPWRSTSVLATSPTLKTGQCMTLLSHILT